MSLRLSIRFLILFVTIIPVVLLGLGGLWIAGAILLAALCLNRNEKLYDGSMYAFLLILLGIICLAIFFGNSSAREAARRATCLHNPHVIGFALHCYHDMHRQFPSANMCDKNGKALFSWRVEILPLLECEDIYNSLKIDEPWNSPHNAQVLSQFKPNSGPIPSQGYIRYYYECPSANRKKNDFSTNYIAVIGPGTAWHEDEPVKFSDLPDHGAHTVMAVEVVNSGVHWAEPRDLTVGEALKNMKTGKGLRISTAHPNIINVLFANGMVRSLPAKMPISLWKKLLAGEVADIEHIEESIDPSAPDMVDVSAVPKPNIWLLIPGATVWLISVVLLFHQAIKSRRKPETAA